MELLIWLENTSVGLWVSQSEWGYMIVLAAHAIGMVLVVGMLFMLSLHVLGLAKKMPLEAFESLMGLAWLGFALNAGSGVLLFMGNAERLAVNVPFLVKIALIAVGGLVAWAFWQTLKPETEAALAAPVAEGTFSARSKIWAIATLVVWFAAIISGRLIGYTVQTGFV